MGEWNVPYLGSRLRATDTKTFAFERPSGLEYAAGQFFFVLLPGSAEKQLRPIEHHFSFSSSPTESVVEFTTRMTGHEYKNRLDMLQAGEVVHLAGPDGAFVLSPEMSKIVYVSAGIGITPARSTVKWALDSGAEVDIIVLYGNRNLEGTAFREEFDAIASDRVRVVNVLSEPDDGWPGPRGHIDADLVRSLVPDWVDRYFFVSGPPGAVDALTRILLDEVVVPPPQVISEHFPGYA